MENSMETIMVVGNGGREHALGWNISQDPRVKEVIYAKGNAGTALDEKCRNVNIDGTKKENFPALADLVEKESIGTIIWGPEQPLVDGGDDFFRAKGFKRSFGPSSAASAIEADKFFSYNIMKKCGVPQAESLLCTTTDDAEAAIYMMSTSKGVVIKARGLTGGKGVYVCDSREEALKKINEHAKAYGPEVLIAERLYGEEFSVFGISDGNRVRAIEMSITDHKRLLDFDEGPNTGGMGAYGPARIADASLVRKVEEEMMTPVVKEMKNQGKEFKGFLYAAVIVTKEGLKILEFNARFGDPEAQPAVMMFKNGIYQPISAALDGKLDAMDIEFRPGAACCVVMASNGYPDKYDKWFPIGGLEQVREMEDVRRVFQGKMEDVKVFHAGTELRDGKVVTSSGRVLGVTAYSPEGVAGAQQKAYRAVETINDETLRLNNRLVFIYRGDIADKGLPDA